MSDYYNILFDKLTIIDTIFIDIKGVLQYPTLPQLLEGNVGLFNEWIKIAEHTYGEVEATDETYMNKAPFYAEFNKIVLITYCTTYMEDGKLKREFEKIRFKDNEALIIDTFFDILSFVSELVLKRTVAKFPYICGYNIGKHQMPLLLKRFFANYKDIVRNKQIPPILKKIITSKPWDTDLLDTQEIWKFGGMGNSPLGLIANSAKFKSKLDCLSLPDLNELYWSDEDEDVIIEKISHQSMNDISINMKLLNSLKNM